VGQWIAARRPGTSVVVVPPVQGKWDLAPIGAHLRAVRRLSPDIFHANLRIPWSCQYGIAAALAARVGAVIAVEQLITPAASSSQRKLKLLTSGLLDAHVAVGIGLAREIEDEVGLPRGTIRTIHNSVEDRPLGSRRAAAVPTVGTLARLAPEKRLDLLVRALATLPDVRLVIVGDGAEREGIERLAESLGVADRLEITGWLRDARSRLPEFDVFALPSDYEGFPHAVLEAMLAELPVVATDVGSVREAVIDGTTGIIVEPGDAESLSACIGALLSDSDRARRMGEAGRALVLERFMPQTMVAAYEALYDEVTS
jgi:glycosyltransferase involved in cell wall biosynthesis